jgi:hypothetical protein
MPPAFSLSCIIIAVFFFYAAINGGGGEKFPILFSSSFLSPGTRCLLLPGLMII